MPCHVTVRVHIRFVSEWCDFLASAEYAVEEERARQVDGGIGRWKEMLHGKGAREGECEKQGGDMVEG